MKDESIFEKRQKTVAWKYQRKDVVRRQGRLSELPQFRIFGFIIRFIKTFETLILKVLEITGLYSPKKFIMGIPSFATRNFIVLQALVFNGTREEVLGFKPRSFIRFLLKGLPDMEAFERVRFQISVSKKALRVVEASTETRGFISAQIAWNHSWELPYIAWLRMQPLGVETLLGRMEVGTYDVYSAPVFFLNENIKWVIISDIDDTIKDSRIAESVSFKQVIRGLFQGHYYRYEAVEGMAELYRILAARGAMIIYVTSTPYQLGPFLLKFLRDSGFPEGPIFLRWLGYNRYGHKVRSLRRILNNVEHQRFVLIGDSGEQDLSIYRRICDNAKYGSYVEKILIRRLPGTELQKKRHPREHFYRSVDELHNELDYILRAVPKKQL